MTINRLAANALYRACDPKQLKFKTTADLPELQEVVAQERAIEAIRFGIGIKRSGYNLYALGPERSGKRSLVTRFIETQGKNEEVPLDWCYVFNFQDPQKPNAISMPHGMARKFEREMAERVAELETAVPNALETDEYRARRQEIEDAAKTRQEEAFEELHQLAHDHGMAMLRTPSGFAFVPTNDKGKVITPEEFEKLSKQESGKIEETAANLRERLQRLLQQIPKWKREMMAEIHELNREVIMAAVGVLFFDLRKNYEQLPEIIDHLDNVQQDVIENADRFRRDDGETNVLTQMFGDMGMQFVSRYRVNVIVDNTDTPGAPVIYIDHPTYPNIVGRVEHQAQMGALVTDFTMIKPGALHTANGGYLVMEASKVLTQPYAWDGLKRALKANEIVIESLGQALSIISTTSLEPEPIPLNVKVVLLGDRLLYYLLCEYDPEFSELFKVAADFDDSIDRSPGNVNNYALFISTLAKKENLKPLEVGAVARIIEEGSRMVEDSTQLSSRFGKVADYVREADYWAAQSGRDVIRREDVDQAINAQDRRMSRLRERLLKETVRGTLRISTEGEEVGQINGLSVVQLGEHAFGHPSRITASVRLGKGEIIDIEREIEMGGPIHSKGVFILSGFLSGRYCPDQPLSLSASLVFEQTYGGVEGDSASSAELYALLSALANLPLRQSLAVTGSVNQHGQIQAIGGVNEKIEGFFAICKERGLNGDHGVIIPVANVDRLMLRQEVIQAVEDGKFSIYAIDSVDEGMALLTGAEVGERDENGDFPENSINGRVEARLVEMAALAHEFAAKEEAPE